MAISQEYLEELSRRVDIVELVGGYVQLKRAGRLEKGLCPFHNEKTPSFCVYPDNNSFYCFGCGEGGSAVNFVQRIQNLDFVDAVKFLAARTGMPMPDEDDSQARLRTRLLAINRETARFYAARLNAEDARTARAYLRRRGLTDATIRAFGLGFAPEGFGALRDYLRREGYAEEELVLAGVCKTGRNNSVYDAFMDRITFPIIDLRGSVIAFGGRRMGDKGPKYLNTGDTPVFKKSRELFALNIARKAGSRRFLLAEGYMDVISLHQAGFTTAVAALGTALSEQQAKTISNYADEVVLCYDSDDAGQKATTRAIGIFANTDIKVTVLNIPGAKDPDEFIKNNGAEKFAQLLDGSRNTIEYALQKQADRFDLTTEDGRVQYLKAALDVLARQASPVEQDIYIGRLAEQTDVGRPAIAAQLEGVVRRRQYQLRGENRRKLKEEGTAAGIRVPYNPNGERALGAAVAEQQLVAAILQNPEENLPLVRGNLVPEQFQNPDLQQAYRLILQKADAGGYIDLTTMADALAPATASLLSSILAKNHDAPLGKADIDLFLPRILEAAQDKTRTADMTAEQLEEYMKYLKDKKSKNTP